MKRPPVMRRRRGELSTERAARQLNYFDRNLASPAAENPVNREMWERQREAALAYLAVRHACTRCGRAHLKTEYEVNGRVYGSECVQHVRQVAS